MDHSRPIIYSPQASLPGLMLGILLGGLAVGLWWWLEEPLAVSQKASKQRQPGASPALFVKEDKPGKTGAVGTNWRETESEVDQSLAKHGRKELAPEMAGTAVSESAAVASTYHATDQADGGGMRATLGLMGVVGTPHVHLHAVLPVKPECYPPEELMTRLWSEAVLTRTGGVVLLGSDSLVAWDEAKPGVAQPLLTPMKVRKLVGTPDEAVILDDQSRVWRIFGGADVQMEVVRDGCRDLFASGLPGKVLVRDAVGALLVLDLEMPGKAQFFTPPQGSSVQNATLSADGWLWVVGGDIWARNLSKGDWESVSGRADEVRAMGKGVLIFNDGFLKAHRLAKAPPSSLILVQMFSAVEGLAVAVQDNIAATAWGDLLDEPAYFEIPKGARQMAVSPAGLVAFW